MKCERCHGTGQHDYCANGLWFKIDCTRCAYERAKQNQAATVADELRTEGHARTRRPLSSAHEPL